jgi:hypothetical protein
MKQENVLRFFKNIINTIITNIIFTLNSSNQKSLIALGQKSLIALGQNMGQNRCISPCGTKPIKLSLSGNG